MKLGFLAALPLLALASACADTPTASRAEGVPAVQARGGNGGGTIGIASALTVNISGSQSVARYQSAQYTANAAGGTAPYTYEWRSRQGNAWSWGAWQSWFSTGSTNYTYASISSCGLDRNQLEVRVTDSLGATATSSITIFISNPC